MLNESPNRVVNLQLNKMSDFSIDHILNRAGGEIKREPQITDLQNNLVTATTLNWLQYSRYHPPKLPRQLRIGAAKRTPGRLPRVPFSPEQLSTLEQAYKRNTYLSAEDANKLADRLDLSSVRVKIWFQNRRARERREKRDLQLSGCSNPEDSMDTIDVETVEQGGDNNGSLIMSE